MKRPLVVFLIVILSAISVHSQQFHSLNGMEDSQGNTQLFYRLGDESFSYIPIYKFNTNTFEESLLISAFYGNYPGGELSKTVTDFEFFPDDETNFINVGEQVNPDNHSYIARNDTLVYGGFSQGFRFVDISKQNPQKVFVFGNSSLVRSWDGGLTFPLDSIYPFTNFVPVAGISKPAKQFDYNSLMSYQYELAKGIGINTIRYGYDFGFDFYSLKGCVLNGIVYGDTSFVLDVNNEKNIIPKEFKLEQNYPNPFNPGTKISWQSPLGSWQTLKVFDVLGNEVATLVDEYKPAGSYGVEFNQVSGIRYQESVIRNFFLSIESRKFFRNQKNDFITMIK